MRKADSHNDRHFGRKRKVVPARVARRRSLETHIRILALDHQREPNAGVGDVGNMDVP